MQQRLLVIASSKTSAEEYARRLAGSGTGPLQVEALPAAEAATALRQEVAERKTPAVVVLAPDVHNAVALAVELRAICRLCHFLFVRDAGQHDRLRQDLKWATLIGAHWSLAKTDDPALARIIREAVQATGRRARLRTTLDRANLQIAAGRNVDSIEYRRQVISEHFLMNFLAQTKDAIVSLDNGLRVLYWNAGAERLFAMTARDAVNRPLAELPFWSEALDQNLRAAIRTRNGSTEEFRCQGPQGEMVLDIAISAVLDSSNAIIGCSLVIRDASDRHRILQEERAAHHETARMLDSERQRLLNLFDQAPGFAVVMQGPQHVIDLANRAYYQIIGYRDVIGKPLQEALPELEGQGLFELLNEAYASGEPYVGRGMRIGIQRTPDAPLEYVFIDFVFQPILGIDGAVTGIFCLGHDVTQQKVLQDALVEYQTELEHLVTKRTTELRQVEDQLRQSQKLDAIGKLTGGVAHDFNNVLQVIAGNLEILQVHSAGDPQMMHRLKTAVAAVERGAKLSSQLLAFARRQPLRPVPTNMGRILGEMDALLRRALGEAIEIETIIGGGLWTVMMDRNQLENAILNLAINARDAMKDGGKLTLELGNAMLDDHYVRTYADVPAGQYVMLAVSDTGTGMPAHVMEQVFEPFFTTKPEGEGTGLGLSMVYGFVKQSGGHIKIYSEPGHGTTVKIYLPRSYQEEMPVPDFKAGPIAGGSETILVVEDDPEVQSTTVETLAGLGYKVLKAKDGQSALSILQSGIPIDLLFTDVVMPGPVRSTDLAAQAKLLLPDVEVLFTSGYTQNAIVHGGRLDPGVELISKPYRREDLAYKIRHMLRNRQQSQLAKPFLTTAKPAVSRRAPDSLHILVVEDEADSREMLCELLSLLGHRVHGTANAEDASDALKADEFDILLTDVSLPGMSGVDLARQALRDKPGLAVIFASGYSMISGADFRFHSLLKPYDLAKLQAVLAETAKTIFSGV